LKRLIRSASLTNYAKVARAAGLDPHRMLREFRLPQACLREIELKIPIEAVRSLLEASAERSGVEAFGLLMAENRRLSNLGPLGLLMREQPTMRQALEALAHYANRMNEALFLTIEEAGEVVVLREELVVGGGSVRQSTELAIGVAFRSLEALLGPAWKPRRVCFAHHAPADRSVHERVFGKGVVEFGHDFNGVVCRRSDLDVANPQADPVLARYARGLIEADLSKRSTDIATQVRKLVIDMLATGKCTIDDAARHLGVTRRTIHRRLHAEGLTFSKIVDEVRRELATRYVADRNRPLAEVSMLLGFSAPSGFSRWHRRHFSSAASGKRKRSTTRPRERRS
jgi:AraC-like DNA-binding protein